MVKVKSRKNVVIAGLIIVGFIIAGGVPGLMTLLGESEVEVVGEGFEYRDVLGGSIELGWDDVLDSMAYVTSWKSDGDSEKIILHGYYKGAYGYDVTPDFKEYWYEVTLDVNNPDVEINGVTGTTWTSPRHTVNDLSDYYWTTCITEPIRITGDCVGKIHVELWGRVMDLNPWSEDDGLLAVDEAYLRSGIGKVQCPDEVVEEDTYARVYVETGYSHTVVDDSTESEGWTLQMFNLNTGVLVYSTAVSDLFAGYKTWMVPVGTYELGGINKIKAILRNVLIDQDDDDQFVVGVGMIDDIPNAPTFEITAGEAPYTPGESITVKVSATKTTYDITGFYVSVSYETSAATTVEYVMRDRWFAAIQTPTGGYCHVTFVFSDTGYVRMEASAYDTMSLPSGNSELTFTVDRASGVTDDEFPDINWLYVIIGAVLIIAAMAIYKQVPKPFNIVVLLALIALGAYFVLLGIGEI